MSKNQDQIARRKATQDTIAANRALFEERMRHYYKEMGLGEWKPRLSPEERAALKAEQEKRAAAAKIVALAEKAGIGVVLTDDPQIEKEMSAAFDGEGVDYPWDQDEPSAEPEPETDDERDDRLAAEADEAAQNVGEARQPV